MLKKVSIHIITKMYFFINKVKSIVSKLKLHLYKQKKFEYCGGEDYIVF